MSDQIKDACISYRHLHLCEGSDKLAKRNIMPQLNIKILSKYVKKDLPKQIIQQINTVKLNDQQQKLLNNIHVPCTIPSKIHVTKKRILWEYIIPTQNEARQWVVDEVYKRVLNEEDVTVKEPNVI